jgi:hypothetical protein
MKTNFETRRPATVQTETIHRLVGLAEQWMTRASRKFRDAAGEQNADGKRLIEHGATCYFNCSEELRKLVDELQSSPTQPAPKGHKKRPV